MARIKRSYGGNSMPTLSDHGVDQANYNELLGINLELIEERKGQAAITRSKRGKNSWKNITTQESAEQASNRAKWSTATMKQVMPRTEVNSDPSGRDHMKLKNHSERGLTSERPQK
ncbi:hypothetical protein Tco_0441738 [Tanacetum coccineum]